MELVVLCVRWRKLANMYFFRLLFPATCFLGLRLGFCNVFVSVELIKISTCAQLWSGKVFLSASLLFRRLASSFIPYGRTQKNIALSAERKVLCQSTKEILWKNPPAARIENVRRKLKKQTPNTKICNDEAKISEQTLMLVFTSKHSAFLYASTTQRQHQQRLMKRNGRNPSRQANYSELMQRSEKLSAVAFFVKIVDLV